MLEFTTVVSDLSSIFRYLLALRGSAVMRFFANRKRDCSNCPNLMQSVLHRGTIISEHAIVLTIARIVYGNVKKMNYERKAQGIDCGR